MSDETEWVLVPREPTAVQVRAGQLGVTTDCTKAIYAAMLAAAPQPPAEAQGGGEVVAYGVYAKSEEYPKPVLLPEYVGSMDVIRGRVLSKARREGFTGDFVERMAELGWWIEPLALASAPPSAPVGVEGLCQVYYDAYHAGHHDTVEGVYVDVLPVDRDTYWQEKVEEDYAAALSQQPAAVEGCLDRLRQHRSQRLWQADLVGGRISVERMRAILTAALARCQPDEIPTELNTATPAPVAPGGVA